MSMKAISKSKLILIPRSLSINNALGSIQTKQTQNRKFYPYSEIAVQRGDVATIPVQLQKVSDRIIANESWEILSIGK